MKRRNKKKCGVYAYLDASGVLENGTGQEIEKAKDQYWKQYRKQWKREKTLERKAIKVVFNFREYRIIKREAERHQTNPTCYIKQKALGNNREFINPVFIGELRELIVLHHNSLQDISEKSIIPASLNDLLLKQIAGIEEKALKLFSLLKQNQ
jgi:hypothetical protein